MSQKYPIGIETFSEIIRGGYAYADKTEVIYRLIQSGKYFFLSRPRRFGKSLMLSTIEAYFRGEKELFQGLWLGEAEGVDWTPRPVMRLNFVSVKTDKKSLNDSLNDQIGKWETLYGVSKIADSLAQRLFNVIEKAYEVTHQKATVLIDEYDKVLVNTLSNPDLHEEMKSILKPIFGVLKAADRYIEFAILTGVSRFSKLSIFSDINNLRDISLSDEFCTICGITEEELLTTFRQGIEDFAVKEGIEIEGMIDILKSNYDGYHFSRHCPDIYNPFSVINALAEKEILQRWFESGTPTFLLEKIRNTDEDLKNLLSPEVSASYLTNTSISDSDLTSLLYQTGYLTIKHYDTEERSFTLGIPNREVEYGIFSGLLPLYTGRNEKANDRLLLSMRRAIRSAKVNEFLETLQSYLAGIPYSLSKGQHEIYYENNLFLIFRLLGFETEIEMQTAQGRIDIVMKTKECIYIIELKLGGSASQALEQIKTRNYALPFKIDGRRLILIGINFSSETRTISDWCIEQDIAF